jgi:hypothetical protein
MIEALFYGERPIAYGSSLINDTFIGVTALLSYLYFIAWLILHFTHQHQTNFLI